MHPRVQGDIGEASAIEWLTRLGALVCVPLFHSPNFDLIAELDGKLVRVEVKTCSRRGTAPSRWQVQVCTHGGNQSWSGTTKRFDPVRCDYVFVHVGDGRRWFLPSPALEGDRAITVGGPKYSEFEVDPGDPLPVQTSANGASTIASP